MQKFYLDIVKRQFVTSPTDGTLVFLDSIYANDIIDLEFVLLQQVALNNYSVFNEYVMLSSAIGFITDSYTSSYIAYSEFSYNTASNSYVGKYNFSSPEFKNILTGSAVIDGTMIATLSVEGYSVISGSQYTLYQSPINIYPDLIQIGNPIPSITGSQGYIYVVSASYAGTASLCESASYAKSASWAGYASSSGLPIVNNNPTTMGDLNNTITQTVDAYGRITSWTSQPIGTASYANYAKFAETASDSTLFNNTSSDQFASASHTHNYIVVGTKFGPSDILRGTYFITSSWAISASYAISSSYAKSASICESASYYPTVTSVLYASQSQWAVSSSFASGSITSSYALHDLTNDVTKEPTGFPNLTDSIINWDNSKQLLSITASNLTNGFKIYSKGFEYTKYVDSASLASTTPGTFTYFYYDNNNVRFSSSLTPWTFQTGDISTATIYWDGRTGITGEERHGIVMDGSTHEYLHDCFGARYVSGFTGVFTASLGKFSVEPGEIQDEDIHHTTTASIFTCRVLYHSASVFSVSNVTNSFYLRASTSPGYVAYDNLTNTASINNPPGTNYGAYWILATNSPIAPIVSLMGQRQDTTLLNAKANNNYASLVFANFPYVEDKVLYRIIVDGNGDVKDVLDLRASQVGGSTYNATAHSALTGLSSDDHLQYLLLAGRVGGQTVVGGITGSLKGTADTASYFGSGTDNYVPVWKSNTLSNTSSIFNNAGNVGIGTTTPLSKLTINDVGIDYNYTASTIRIVRINNAGYSFNIGYTLNGTNYGGTLQSLDNGNGSTILLNPLGGNVGIGTTAPGALLHVQGNISSSAITASHLGNTVGTASWAISCSFATTASYSFIVNTTSSTNFQSSASWASQSLSSSYLINNGTTGYYPTWINGGQLSSTSSLYNYNNSVNVGIGAADLGSKVLIYSGSLITSSNASINWLSMYSLVSNVSALNFKINRTFAGSDWTSAATRIQHKVDGTDMGYIEFNPSASQQSLAFGMANIELMRFHAYNVGIANKAPGYRLVIGDGTNNTEIVQTKATSSGYGGGYLVSNEVGNFGFVGNRSAWYGSAYDNKMCLLGYNGLEFDTANAIRMVIDTAGNVGIGITTPGALLHVQGNISASSVTANLVGTASWATNAIQSLNTTQSIYATSASRASSSISSSYSATSSYIGSGTSGYYPIWNNNTLTNTSSIFNLGSNVGIGTITPQNKLDVTQTYDGTGIQYPSIFKTTLANDGAILHAVGFNIGPRIYGNTDATGSVYASAAAGGLGLGGNGFIVLTSTESIQGSPRSWVERMRIEPSTGNVGIGTTSPLTNLHIDTGNSPALVRYTSGVFLSTNGGPNAGSCGYELAFSSSGLVNRQGYLGMRRTVADSYNGMELVTVTNHPIRFLTSGSANSQERMRITENGNVGIGITTPGYKSHIQADSGSLIWGQTIGNYAHQAAVGPGVGLKLQLGYYPAAGTELNKWAGLMAVSETGYEATVGLAIYTGQNPAAEPTEKVRINSLGYVGIGTTAPSTKLNVYGSASANQVYNTDPILLLSKNTGTRVADEGVSLGFNSGTNFLYGAIKGSSTNSTGGESGGYLSFYTTYKTSAHFERMRIDENGNVGIGITTPGYKSHIQADSGSLIWGQTIGNYAHQAAVGPGVGLKLQLGYYPAAGTELNKWAGLMAVSETGYEATVGLAIYTGQNPAAEPTEKVRINSLGYVGIGTTTPTNILCLGDDLGLSSVGKRLVIGSTSSNSYVHVGQDATHNMSMKWTYSNTASSAIANINTFGYNNDLYLDAKNVILQSQYAGNVGIGTTTPGATLHVQGNISSSNLYASNVAQYTFVVLGDSISTPVPPSPRDTWVMHMDFMSELWGKSTRYNYATSGWTSEQVSSSYMAGAYTVRPTINNQIGTLVIWAGANDLLTNTSSATIYSNLKSIWAQARADKYFVVAVVPTSCAGFTGGQWTQYYNLTASIIGDTTLYDTLIRADTLIPNMAAGPYGGLDGVHPSVAGATELGRTIGYTIDGYKPYRLRMRFGYTGSAGLDLILNAQGNDTYVKGEKINPSAAADGDTLVRRTATGVVVANTYQQTGDFHFAGGYGVSSIICKATSGDNNFYEATPAQVRTFITASALATADTVTLRNGTGLISATGLQLTSNGGIGAYTVASVAVKASSADNNIYDATAANLISWIGNYPTASRALTAITSAYASNAGTLGGYGGSSAATANTYCLRDANAIGLFNGIQLAANGGIGGYGIASICVKATSGDNNVYDATAANVRSFLGGVFLTGSGANDAIPKFSGGSLVASSVSDNGTRVWVDTYLVSNNRLEAGTYVYGTTGVYSGDKFYAQNVPGASTTVTYAKVGGGSGSITILGGIITAVT